MLRVTASGGDCHGQQLRCPGLFGDWLTVRSQASDVNLDRLDGPWQWREFTRRVKAGAFDRA